MIHRFRKPGTISWKIVPESILGFVKRIKSIWDSMFYRKKDQTFQTVDFSRPKKMAPQIEPQIDNKFLLS